MKETSTQSTFDTEGDVKAGCLIKNCTDKKYYKVSDVPNQSTIIMEYVGFWKNTWYLTKDWFKELKSKIVSIYRKKLK